MVYGYRYRGYGRRSRNDGEDKRSRITHLDKLSIKDLKKLIKSLQNKETKQIEHEKNKKLIEEEKIIFEQELKVLIKDNDRQNESHNIKIKPYTVEYYECQDFIDRELKPGIMDVFKNVISVGFNRSGLNIRILEENLHHPTVRRHGELRKIIDKLNHEHAEQISKPFWSKERELKMKINKPLKKFNYANPSLSINGHRMIFDTDKWTIDEIEKVLNEKIELEKKQKQEEQDKLDSLKSRAAQNEAEVRQQADKYRDVEGQLEKFKGCPYCLYVMDKSNAEQDHIYPVAKGGKSTRENLVYICSECNRSKGKLTLNKFIVKNNLDRDKIHTVLDYLGKDY